MLKKILFFGLLVIFTACNFQGKFRISGNITDADGKMLYLEQTGLLKDSLIDSVKLTKEGTFNFRSPAPEYPELYRLKLGTQQLILAVDSTETIEIKGAAGDLISASITGSMQSEDIQTLRKSVIALQQRFDVYQSEKEAVKSTSLADSFQVNLEKHKKTAQGIILKNPNSMAAYYALYQQINGNFIFSPYVKSERPYYQAVATTFQAFMPEYERSKNLYNLVLGAIREDRLTRQQSNFESLVKVESTGFIEIELKNTNGYPQKLSSLIGKPILLDFSAYGTETSIDYTFALREIFTKYSPRGLQIYQVSLDQSKILWQRSVATIPWICVFDETGSAANAYNVQQIPTMYLINKEGIITGKYANVKSLEADLGKIL